MKTPSRGLRVVRPRGEDRLIQAQEGCSRRIASAGLDFSLQSPDGVPEVDLTGEVDMNYRLHMRG